MCVYACVCMRVCVYACVCVCVCVCVRVRGYRYPCASMVIAMSFGRPDGAGAPRRQRHFLGHTAPVTVVELARNGQLMASAQSTPRPTIRVWDFARARSLAVLGAHASALESLSFSDDGRMLAAMGRDSRHRALVVVWDVSAVAQGRHAVVARQVSDFPITRIRFSPYDLTRLVSCGRENVRFWRVTKAHLRGCPVILNQFARASTYTDLAFESGYGARAIEQEAQRRVFVASDAGTVLQVNYETRELECVFRLHDAAIHSIAVNEGFCVTASADHYLRLWPLDFSDFFLEAQHKGAVTSACVSPDGLNVGVGTAGGTIGVLDVGTHAYHTLLRAHTSDIHDMAVRQPPPGMHADASGLGVGVDATGNTSASSGDAFSAELATVSSDGFIRVWSLDTWDPLYEFESPGQVPTAVAFHPYDHVIAVGFESGHLRVFDVPSTSVVCEYQQHTCAVRAVRFLPEGGLVYTAAEDGHVCMYDCNNDYAPVRVASSGFPPKLCVVVGPPVRSPVCCPHPCVLMRAVPVAGVMARVLQRVSQCCHGRVSGCLVPRGRLRSPGAIA